MINNVKEIVEKVIAEVKVFVYVSYGRMCFEYISVKKYLLH